MHRVVLERILGRSLEHGEYTDHINGNKLDNRRENLRVATVQQNGANARTPAHNSSGIKGVRFHHGKWCAQIKVNQKNIHLGSFDTPEQARQAYFEAAERYFGEFARRE